MRIRRKPWARPELEACNFFLSEPLEYSNKFENFFDNSKPIFLELGCGKGGFISKIAVNNIKTNFIGIDIKDEVLVLAKRKIEQEFLTKQLPLDNILLLAYNIERIADLFDQQQNIAGIYINFCNPWPKLRHQKRRLTHPRQLEQYKKFLPIGAKIYFKTDDIELFMDSINYFNETGFNIIYKTYDLHLSNYNQNIQTEHEQQFSEQSIKIKFLIAQRRN